MLTLTHSIWASPPMFKGLINKSFDVKVTGPLQDEEAIRGGLISASSSLSMYKAMGFFDRSQREREREARFEALKERHSIYNLPDSSAMQGMVKRVNLRKKQGRSAGGPQELPVYITVLRDIANAKVTLSSSWRIAEASVLQKHAPPYPAAFH